MTERPLSERIGCGIRMGASLFVVLVLAFSLLAFNGCKLKKIDHGNEPEQAPRTPEEAFSKAVRLAQGGFDIDAEEGFKGVMEDHPLSAYALEAQLLLADLYYRTDKYEDAASYYASFVTLHPAHPRAEYAYFQKGMSYLKQVSTIDRDQVSTRKAYFAFNDLLVAYPEGPYSGKAREMVAFLRKRLATSEFHIGRFYYKDKNYKGALVRFKEVVEKYSDTDLIDKTLYHIGMSYLKLGEDKLAREVFTTLVENYPKSDYFFVAKRKVKKLEKKAEKKEKEKE